MQVDRGWGDLGGPREASEWWPTRKSKVTRQKGRPWQAWALGAGCKGWWRRLATVQRAAARERRPQAEQDCVPGCKSGRQGPGHSSQESGWMGWAGPLLTGRGDTSAVGLGGASGQGEAPGGELAEPGQSACRACVWTSVEGLCLDWVVTAW